MTGFVLRRRRDLLLAVFSLSFLIPVGWIIGTELTDRLEDSRIMSRVEAQMLAEHAVLALTRTDVRLSEDQIAEYLREQLSPEQTLHLDHTHNTTYADLIVVYGTDGTILLARDGEGLLDTARISQIPLLRGIASEVLQSGRLAEVETERVIATTFKVPDYSYRLIAAYDRRQIVRDWLAGALPIVLVVIALVVVIVALTSVMHREIYNRFRAEESRAHEGLRYFESLRVLAGGLAHQVNNQMMVVIGNADILVDELGTPAPGQRFITAIRSAAKQASDLSVRMLATAGTANIHRTPYTLATILRYLSAAVRETAGSECVLSTTLDPEHRTVSASVDPDYMKIAMSGLVANAMESYPDTTQPKVVTLHISVTRWEQNSRAASAPEQWKYSDRLTPGQYVSFSVTDHGPGIPRQTMDHLFEPFFSTGFLGRGLGLSAVAGIARQHGGGVIVHTQEGVGTTVTTMIPLDDPSE